MSKYIKREDFEKADAFGVGSPNSAFAQYFIGNSFLKTLTNRIRQRLTFFCFSSFWICSH